MVRVAAQVPALDRHIHCTRRLTARMSRDRVTDTLRQSGGPQLEYASGQCSVELNVETPQVYDKEGRDLRQPPRNDCATLSCQIKLLV